MIIKFASVTSNPRGKRRCMIVYLYCMANFIYLFFISICGGPWTIAGSVISLQQT